MKLLKIFNVKLGTSTVSTDKNIIDRWCPLQTTNVLLIELLRSIMLWCLLHIMSFLLVKSLFQYAITRVFTLQRSVLDRYTISKSIINGSFPSRQQWNVIRVGNMVFSSSLQVGFLKFRSGKNYENVSRWQNFSSSKFLPD